MSSLKLYPSGNFCTIPTVFLSLQFLKECPSKIQLPLDLLAKSDSYPNNHCMLYQFWAIAVLIYFQQVIWGKNSSQSCLLLRLARLPTLRFALCRVSSSSAGPLSVNNRMLPQLSEYRKRRRKVEKKKKGKKNLVASMTIPPIIKPQTTQNNCATECCYLTYFQPIG